MNALYYLCTNLWTNYCISLVGKRVITLDSVNFIILNNHMTIEINWIVMTGNHTCLNFLMHPNIAVLTSVPCEMATSLMLFFDICQNLHWLRKIIVIWKNDQLNPFPNNPWFLRVCSTSLLKTLWEKEKLLITSNSSFSHSVFYSLGWTYCQFHRIGNCRLLTLSVWKSLKFVIWERVKCGKTCIKISQRCHRNFQPSTTQSKV